MPKASLKNRRTLQGFLAAAMCFALIVGGIYVQRSIESASLEAELREQREYVREKANSIRYRLEAETLSTFHLATGLGSYISANPGMNEEEFRRIAKEVFEARPGLVNIAAAPDMVIRFVYPLEGNEAALGLDYNTHPAQRAAAIQVKETGSPVIAGPVDLVQGGSALIGRFPVYSENESGRHFWGILSTPLDVNELYSSSGLKDPNLTVEISLRGKDGKGMGGEVFYGNESVFDESALLMPVHLFSGVWVMGARPLEGWVIETKRAQLIRFEVWSVCILLVIIVILLHVHVMRLERSREMEKSVSRAKSRFLANMSHEIKTPLNGICGLAEVLRDSPMEEDQKELVRVILKSSVSLSELMSDVLKLSLLDSGRFQLNVGRVELEPLIASVIDVVRIELNRKQLDFKYSGVPTNLKNITADGSALRQIVWNLLSNAVKFTQTGRVELDIESWGKPGGPEGLRIIVSDTGIGISEDRIESIFDDFEQEDGSASRKYEGAGLGLAIVRRLVDQIGGKYRVESEQGKGSRFEVDILVESIS